jgi:hypothetical protein
MQEITPSEAAQSRPFPTSAIIKEAWQLSTTYFWPFILAIFVIGFPSTIITAFIEDPRRSFQFNGFYDTFISGFVMIGCYRSIYLLKSEGKHPTFSGIFAEGNMFYALNVRQSFLIGLYAIGIGIAITLLVLPCWELINSKKEETWPYLLFAISVILAIFAGAWCLIRLMLYRAALADDATSARKSVSSCLALTKGKVRRLTPLSLVLGSGIIAWMFLVTAALMIPELAYDAPMTKANELILMVLLDIPLAFWQAFMIAALALSYRHLKESSKTAEGTPVDAPAGDIPLA